MAHLGPQRLRGALLLCRQSERLGASPGRVLARCDDLVNGHDAALPLIHGRRGRDAALLRDGHRRASFLQLVLQALHDGARLGAVRRVRCAELVKRVGLRDGVLVLRRRRCSLHPCPSDTRSGGSAASCRAS